MINYSQAVLKQVFIHRIGSYQLGEDIQYSTEAIDLSDETLYQSLLKFCLANYKEPEFFRFSFSGGALELNPVYNFAGNIFDDPDSLLEQSVKIARHLYEKSKHPNIHPGELIIAYITDILVEDELTDALAVIKSEAKDNFLKIMRIGHQFRLQHDTGANLQKLDKACLIINADRDEGFNILNVDHLNRSKDALYWRDEFLGITPRSDEYHQTRDYIQLTKKFVKERLPETSESVKVDEAAIMMRSFEYFHNNEKFSLPEYEVQVFKDGKTVEAFKEFKSEYSQNRTLPFEEQFEISEYAVKKQSRVFRSVIKLDRNFHIYVHGDKDKIAKGVDENGKKYYILYYDEEN
jgi:hypothetical protein